MHKVELLSPAGNREAFLGALKAGADAFYMGGPHFGARAYADNFTEEELIRTIEDAHLFGKKVYITVNVLTKESELEDTAAFVERMYAHGLDGVIVQDLGVVSILRERCRGLLLHASTQMSVTSCESVRFLKRMGISRVVPARELSLAEMRRMKEKEPIEIEAFIHGAMCYSYSGRCLMSSMLGGRSGNRGRCAGTCRLPYTIIDERGNITADGECYPLSMRDMCVLDILPQLMDAQLDSFKIEGRMKRAEYAAGTTAIYRRYIDRFYDWDASGRTTPWMIERKDRAELLNLYIRKDLSTGYYQERNGRDLLTIQKGGYAGADDALLQKVRREWLDEPPEVEASGELSFYTGAPAVLTLSAEGAIVTAQSGQSVQAAKNRPMGESDLRAQIGKMGGTSFCLRHLQVYTDGESFLPVSALNALRRDALAALRSEILRKKAVKRDCSDIHYAGTLPGAASVEELPCEKREKIRTDFLTLNDNVTDFFYVIVSTADQARAAVSSGCTSVLILEEDLIHAWDDQVAGICGDAQRRGTRLMAAMPYIFRESDRADEEKMLSFVQEKGDLFAGMLARSLEEVEFLREKGYDRVIITDSMVYIWNHRAAKAVLSAADGSVLPLELSAKDLEEMLRRMDTAEGKTILPVYGRIPMMITAGCVRKTSGACRHHDDGFWFLEDRTGAHFPVRTICAHCGNVIFNSVPLSLDAFYDNALYRRIRAKLFHFTDESGGRTERILCAFRGQQRIFSAPSHGTPAFTTGHFRKSAL